jgi:hypothetical protein
LDREDVAGVAERYPVLADRLEDVATRWLDGEGLADGDRPAKVEPVQTPVEKLTEKVSQVETQIANLVKQQTDMQKGIQEVLQLLRTK